MEFDFWSAVIAGIAGGVVMTAMMMMAKAAGLTRMDMALIEGSMFTGDAGKAKVIGMFMHLIIMSGVVIGSIYAALFAGFDVSESNAWWYGLVFGAVHGVIAGMAMVMMPAMHPRMSAQPSTGSGGLHLDPPGLFAHNMGKATPAGLMMAHMVYGLVLAIVYAALV